MSTELELDVAASFAVDVAEHCLIVRQDQGLHRHLVFERAEHSWNNRFELITAPGSLTITGSRGSFTFRRLTDMFQFFRCDPDRPHRINIDYWAEKLPDSGRSVQVHSEQAVKELLEEALKEWVEYGYADASERYQRDLQAWEANTARFQFNKPAEPKTVEELRETIEEHETYGSGLQFAEGARELLAELERLGVASDTWEWDLNDWDFHFVWCLHAIAWGIQQYDRAVRDGLHTPAEAPTGAASALPTVAPELPLRPANRTTETLTSSGGVL